MTQQQNTQLANATLPGAPLVPNRASAIAQLAGRFNVEPEKMMTLLRNTVIKPTREGREATNEEVAAFAIVANQYNLNPFTREIHAFADPQRGVVPIVGIDGWAHIVNAEQSFDGCEFEEIVVDNDLGVRCTMYVKGRAKPTSITEWLSECKRNTAPWNTMKRRMLRHKAYMQCARVAFSIGGIYDDDEARDIINGEVVSARTVTPTDELNVKLKAAREKSAQQTIPPKATLMPPTDPPHEQPVEEEPQADPEPPPPPTTGAAVAPLDTAPVAKQQEQPQPPVLGDDPTQAELERYCVSNRPTWMSEKVAKDVIKGNLSLLEKQFWKLPAGRQKEICELARRGEWPAWPSQDQEA